MFKKKIKKCYYCDKVLGEVPFEKVPIYQEEILGKIVCEFVLSWFKSCEKCRKYQRNLTKKEFDKRIAKKRKKLNGYIMARDMFLKNKK